MECSSLQSQIVLITGGADGIGFAIARKLAAAGAYPCLLDNRAEMLRHTSHVFGGACDTHVVDVTHHCEVGTAITEIVEKHGRLDIVVNSAGITGETGRKSHEVKLEDFDRVFNVNVKGTFAVCRAALPEMMKRGYGRILNIASIAGKDGNAGMVAYSASKAAVIGLTKSMGKEYAETGITVNALAPAVIRTGMVDTMPEEQVRYMTEKIPMKRCATLEECAVMAEFIVSPENSFCTGFTFDLSGGRAVY